MKKIVLQIIPIFFFLIGNAQEEKPNLLIGRYNTEKSFMCSPRAWISEGVNDRQEYAIKSKQFMEAHKTSNPAVEFVSAKECVIVFEFNKKSSGFDCKPLVQGIIRAATIEKCEEQFKMLNSKDYASPPKIVFTWCGKGLGSSQKQTLTTDYSGVSGTYTLVKKPSGGDFFVAQLTNTTTDKIATVLIRTDTGELIAEELAPGSTLTKSYKIKTLEIDVIYRNQNEPKQSYDIIKWMRDKEHDILEVKDGVFIKSKGKMGSAGVRG